MDQISIVIADDHPLYREGVARTLMEDKALIVVGQAQDAGGAVELAARLKPDLLLLDISMPGGGGLAALREAITLPDAPKIAMLTASEEDDQVMQALKAGALGYVLKGVGARELVGIVKDLARGQTYVSPVLAGRLLASMRNGGAARPANPLADLSKREEDILRLVAEGKSNKEIGLTLDLQEKTVKHYMTSILQKLHLRNRVEAAVLAREHLRR
ncbi:DNA-binding response regulator [Gemmobacter aquaticus]|uniref:DNA-binding response regulator n=1 Tax=Gemmobacter aquaticus TaxID=490185 RepID=A0A917YL71_9RHOB|nr:response regulator transcription factor [Gemmobacter aquaticus]GGO36034.1 DNA-binding response regulator [Gemmobacter aquaticus]